MLASVKSKIWNVFCPTIFLHFRMVCTELTKSPDSTQKRARVLFHYFPKLAFGVNAFLPFACEKYTAAAKGQEISEAIFLGFNFSLKAKESISSLASKMGKI
jgi:hypothetical protein